MALNSTAAVPWSATLPFAATKNGKASLDPGELPDCPNAVRRRSWLMNLTFGKNGSSQTSQEMLPFG